MVGAALLYVIWSRLSEPGVDDRTSRIRSSGGASKFHEGWDVNDKLKARLEKVRNTFPLDSSDSKDTLKKKALHSHYLDVFRQVPDTRYPECKSVQYDLTSLPTITVIIPFHNEIWSDLLRTVNSVLFRTPHEILEEILLVDDASTLDPLKLQLEEYARTAPRTRIIRLDERQGSVRARMRAAQEANGDVIAFLDSHVEVGYHWAEPLLAGIAENARIVAVPHLDAIRMDTLEYTAINRQRQGSFTWDFQYVMKDLPKRLAESRNRADPYPTPTFLGTAFAIDRKFFFRIGAFDEGMQRWGGEDLELSFRAWQCAEGVRIFPCSRVGHLFRIATPFNTIVKPGGDTMPVVQKNYQRAVDVWLGDYAKFYYAVADSVHQYTPQEAASLSERKYLRDRLYCKSFDWYLDNVAPETFRPWTNSSYQGQVRNAHSLQCMSLEGEIGSVGLEDCQDSPRQYFYLLHDGRLFYNHSHCLQSRGPKQQVFVGRCPPAASGHEWDTETWLPEELAMMATSGNIVHLSSRTADGGKLCLVDFHRKSSLVAGMSACDKEHVSQYWMFTYHIDPDELHKLN